MTFTDNEKAIINSSDSVKLVRLEFPDEESGTIGEHQIYQESLSLEESIFEGDVLKFGECNGSLFKIRVADFVEDIQNARMNVYVHYTNEELGEVDVPFGKYIVSNVERTSDRRWRDITATDYMSKFDVDIADWYNNTLYPTSETTRTAKEIRTMLCSYIGVKQNSAWDESALSYTIDIRGEGTPPTDVYPGLYRDKHYLDTLTGYVYVCVENDRFSDRWDFVEELYALINDRLEIGKTIETQTLKGRDLLKAICEINACFGHFDWNGVLKYITLEFDGLFPSDTLYPSNDLYPRAGTDSGVNTEHILRYKQDGCNYADYDVQDIDSVAIMKEDGDLAVHAELEETYTNRYNIVGNFLLYGFSTEELEDIAETILSKIGDCSYRPNTTTIYGGVYMQIGQDYVVNATTYVGTEVIDKKFYSYLLKRTITGIQAMYSTLEAMGEQYQPEVPTYDVANELKVLQGKSAKYRRDLEGLEVEYRDFAEGTEAHFGITDQAISSEVTRATNAEGSLSTRITQTADSISSEVTRATNAEENLSSRVEQTAESITSTVAGYQTIWDETGFTIQWKEYGITDRIMVESGKTAPKTNDYYLDVETGKLYKIASVTKDTEASDEDYDYYNITLASNPIQLTTTRSAIETQIIQLADSITLEVTGGVGNTASIVLKVDGQTQGTGTIDLTGLVTFTNLSTAGQTTINGANIQTGTLSADKITTGTMSCDRLDGGTISGQAISGGTISGATINATNSIQMPTYYGDTSVLTTDYGQVVTPTTFTVGNSNLALVLLANALGITTTSIITTYGGILASSVHVLNPGTSSGSANCRLTTLDAQGGGTAGLVWYASGSSLRYKHDIKLKYSKELDPHRLYNIKVYQYKFQTNYIDNEGDIRYDKNVIGFIVEQVARHYPIACDWHYDKKKDKIIYDDWDSKYIIPPMLKLIQEQHEQIESQQQEINNLKDELATLKEQVAFLMQGGK